MKNRNVVRATGIYLVFFTVMATEHVFEHSYAAAVLGFDLVPTSSKDTSLSPLPLSDEKMIGCV